MTNQIVVLAAGKGKRMGGEIPKVLIDLKNKPLILYLLHELENINQLTKPVIVVGFKAEEVRAVLGNDYVYAYQDKQLGTAHALQSAKHKVKAENILVLYGDMPFIKADSLRKLMSLHLKSGSKLSMCTATAPNFEGVYKSLASYGRIIRNKEGRIVKITEVKDATEQERQLLEVNPGIYMFNSSWLWENLSKIKNQNMQQEYYLTDIVELAILEGEQLHSITIDPSEVLGVNTNEDLDLALGSLNK